MLRYIMQRWLLTSKGNFTPLFGYQYCWLIMRKRKSNFEKDVRVVSVKKSNNASAFDNFFLDFRDNVASVVLQIKSSAKEIAHLCSLTEPNVIFIREFFGERHCYKQPRRVIRFRAKLVDVCVGTLLTVSPISCDFGPETLTLSRRIVSFRT